MEYAVITTKIDPKTKKEAMEAAELLGMPLSVVIKAFLKQFVRTKSVAFSAENGEPSPYLKSVMEKARDNWINDKRSPSFSTGKSAIKWLEKQGV